MFESLDAETIGIEGQPYTMRVSIVLWPAYGCVGSFGEVSLSDLSSLIKFIRFILPGLASLPLFLKFCFHLIIFIFVYVCMSVYLSVCVVAGVVTYLLLQGSSDQVVKLGSKGLYLLSHLIAPPPFPSVQ